MFNEILSLLNTPRYRTLLRRGITLLILLVLGLWSYCSFLSPGSPPGDGSLTIQYEVPRGAGVGSVSRDLAQKKILRNPDYFRLYLRITGRARGIKAGFYELNDAMSAEEIADILTSGKVQMISLTIPEGWNRKQIGDYLAEKGLVRNRAEFLLITRDRNLLRKYRIPGKSTEGYLFPDTYSVPHGFSARRLQSLMVRQFFARLKGIGAPENIDPQRLHRQVILASIVEREAVNPDERPMMARVFMNRLENHMRLESCATIQFLLKKPRERLYNKDLRIESPYNTYRHEGLPPGPISNPGLAALKAVFNPKPGPYLYFVLKPDRSHHFSVTYAEHLRAKKQYLGR